MATNPYFSQAVRSEQGLYEDIVIESLKLYGQDIYYLPRDIVNEDLILGEDVSSRFNSSHKIEMYIENTEGFDGEGDLFSKFGVEIRDQATFIVARKRWDQTVLRHDNEIVLKRPAEGDLLFIPFSNRFFEITSVETELPFYQLSQLPTYKLRCELFVVGNEDIDTGNDYIDNQLEELSYQYKLILNTGKGATATATNEFGLGSVTLTDSGDRYTEVPIITVSEPNADPADATATVTLNGASPQAIASIDLTDSGAYFHSAPSAVVSYIDTSGDSATINTTTTISNGKVSGVAIPTIAAQATTYASIVIAEPTGSKTSFTATLLARLDSAQGKIRDIEIVDSGGLYYSNPTVTIAKPTNLQPFVDGDTVTQTLASGVNVKGEVLKWSDSDKTIYLINVGADDGKFHEFVTGRDLVTDSGQRTDIATGSVTTVLADENNVSKFEQNTIFDVDNNDFLDFTETNPFGEPT